MSDVYKAIVNVMSELCKDGIAKNRQCTQGTTYKFRGIDDVYNALAPIMSVHGLCIMPRMLNRNCVERTSAKGNALFYTTVEAEFDFVSSSDGSKHTVRTFGEAMDTGDKGTNKAMSAAYKYAAFQTFCIPTEGDNDSETQTHNVTGDKHPQNVADNQPNKPSANAEKWLDWIDNFTKANLDVFLSEWEKYGVKAVAGMNDFDRKKILGAKGEMENFLMEKANAK